MKITEILKYRFSVTDSISLTNSSNTNVHSGVFRLKHSTVLFVITFLFSCLPQFVNAQMTTIVTCHKVLFCQTPKETAKADKKIAEKKMNAEMKEEKEYKEGKLIQVKDPEGFYANQKNRLFSGPQSAEKLPPFQVKGIDGKQFDIAAHENKKPIVLFLQDANGVGIKGLVNATRVLLKIDRIHKRRMPTDAEKSKQGLQVGVVILADEIGELPEWAQRMFKDEIPDVVLKGISQDGREGPGSYGLNRNVSQTVIVVKDGRVLHNFAFTQPMLYVDSHLLGAVAQAIDVEPAKLERWLNNASQKTSNKEIKSKEDLYVQIQNAVKEGRLSKSDVLEKLKVLGFSAKEGDELLKNQKENALKMDAKVRMEREGKSERDRNPSREELVKRFDKDGDGVLNLEEGKAARRALATRESQNRNRRTHVEVKDPDEFKKVQEKVIFSGPQPNEKLPPLMATALNGVTKDKTSDFIANANEQPLVLILQDETPLGLRGLVGLTRILDQIATISKKKFHTQVVFFGDSPDVLTKQVSRIIPHVSSKVLLGISPDGREGPGSYGLNRNVAQTILIVKDGKVIHNFALTQPMLSPDPYVLGAVGELIGQTPTRIEKWLNRESVESRKMEK